MRIKVVGLLALALTASFTQAQTVTSGLIPKSPTFYVNTNYLNNGSSESLGVAIAANGNVLLGFEDDGSGIYDFEAAWTLFDGNGNMLTLPTVQTNRDLNTPLTTFESITNTYLSYLRSDGTPTGAYLAWGPKIKANPYGNGIGMGAVGMTVGLEVSQLFDINIDAGGGGDFPVVQLMDNNANPLGVGLTVADANAEPAGDMRIADWDYLSTGNILIVGESRQADDRALTGQPGGNVPVYRIVTPTGTQVKAYSAVSTDPVGADMWHGAGVTSNGFALRFNSGGVVSIRMFDNAGNPTSANIGLAALTGHPEAGGGGRGDGAGFHGNGKDAYVHVCSAAGGAWVTVLNANGTVRWSRAVNDATDTFVANRVDGAITPDGRVIAVWDSALANATPDVTNRLVQARLFSASGQPLSGRFVVSEWENPSNPSTTNIAQAPRVAWRNDTIAITWVSQNAPSVLEDPFGPYEVAAARIFSSAVLPKSDTFYVNTNFLNNGSSESLGVGIAANGNVLIGFEDDGSGIYDFEAAWTLFDGNGNMLTLPTVQTNRDLNTPLTTFESITNTYLSYFRSDGTPTGAYLAWGPKIKANPYGNGIGMGGVGMTVGLEVSQLFDVNIDAGGGGDFPVVQLMDNNANPLGVGLTVSDANAEPAGDMRIADWDYLSTGNILIVGESRQADDRALTGQPGGNVPVYRIVTPTGTQVKAFSAVSSDPVGADMWHGAGVTSNGFALRFNSGGVVTIRLFDNAGNPTSANIGLAALTGHPEAGGGGRGDGAGFHGNYKDAYVHMCSAAGGAWLTVLNANGSVRWSHSVNDTNDTFVANRVDAAIGTDGRVIAVWDSALPNAQPGVTNRLIQARLFNADGTPVGSRFVVSEWENPANPATTNIAQAPRIAWRGDTAVVAWVSQNAPTVLADPFGPYEVTAAKILTVGTTTPSLNIARAGANVVVSWTGGGTLQSAPLVTGPWSDLGNTNPATFPASGGQQFFRVRAW